MRFGSPPYSFICNQAPALVSVIWANRHDNVYLDETLLWVNLSYFYSVRLSVLVALHRICIFFVIGVYKNIAFFATNCWSVWLQCLKPHTTRHKANYCYTADTVGHTISISESKTTLRRTTIENHHFVGFAHDLICFSTTEPENTAYFWVQPENRKL